MACQKLCPPPINPLQKRRIIINSLLGVSYELCLCCAIAPNGGLWVASTTVVGGFLCGLVGIGPGLSIMVIKCCEGARPRDNMQQCD